MDATGALFILHNNLDIHHTTASIDPFTSSLFWVTHITIRTSREGIKLHDADGDVDGKSTEKSTNFDVVYDLVPKLISLMKKDR
ncbi:hypothetical protein LXL04_003974 [Taraxacum kok-saghyz]